MGVLKLVYFAWVATFFLGWVPFTTGGSVSFERVESDAIQSEDIPMLTQPEATDEAHAIIQRMYLKYLGRPADPGGLKTYSRCIIEDGKNEEWLAGILEKSEEWQQRLTRRRQAVSGGVFLFLSIWIFLFALWLTQKVRCGACVDAASLFELDAAGIGGGYSPIFCLCFEGRFFPS